MLMISFFPIYHHIVSTYRSTKGSTRPLPLWPDYKLQKGTAPVRCIMDKYYKCSDLLPPELRRYSSAAGSDNVDTVRPENIVVPVDLYRNMTSK